MNPPLQRFGAGGDHVDAASSRVSRKRQDAASTYDVDLAIRWLGRMNFSDALALQEEIVARKRTDENSVDELLLLEHDPVYTIGRTPDQSSLLAAKQLPHPLFTINRGGQATYHGPGQLIGYPIVDLRRCGQDLHKYLRWLERTLIEFLADYEIVATQRDGLTGVWVGPPSQSASPARTSGAASSRKIASIGVGVRHWITMHGFALNVCGDLSPFSNIVPCGISNVVMTSMESEMKGSVSVADVAMAFEKFVLRKMSNLRVADVEKATLV